MKLEWVKKQNVLAKDRLSSKEVNKINQERKKKQDLKELSSLGGPFTTDKDVEEYMKSNLPEKKKVDRLYKEVRYAKATSLFLDKSSEVFRLKRKYRTLDSEEYSKNLIIMFRKFSSSTEASMEDFLSAVQTLRA